MMTRSMHPYSAHTPFPPNNCHGGHKPHASHYAYRNRCRWGRRYPVNFVSFGVCHESSKSARVILAQCCSLLVRRSHGSSSSLNMKFEIRTLLIKSISAKQQWEPFKTIRIMSPLWYASPLAFARLHLPFLLHSFNFYVVFPPCLFLFLLVSFDLSSLPFPFLHQCCFCAAFVCY